MNKQINLDSKISINSERSSHGNTLVSILGSGPSKIQINNLDKIQMSAHFLNDIKLGGIANACPVFGGEKQVSERYQLAGVVGQNLTD